MIIKTLISTEPHIVNNLKATGAQRSSCFELYGFDIIIDSQLKPWLLEVNIHPSLAASSPLDLRVKKKVFVDLLNIAGVLDSKKYKRAPAVDYRMNLRNSFNATDISFNDAQVIVEGEDEMYRRGSFKRIFPLEKNIDRYAELFEAPRLFNTIYWHYIKENDCDLKKHFRRMKNPTNV